jgi:protein-disulfide isomerase
LLAKVSFILSPRGTPAMKEKLLNLLTALTACCALFVTIGAFRSGQVLGRATPADGTTQPRAIANGTALTAVGPRVGPPNAVLTIVEFGDFECPACIAFAQGLRDLRREYPRDIALVYRHMPLSYHKLAYPLARASECAAQQGRFEDFYRAVLEERAELGMDPIGRLVELTDVHDKASFRKCASSTEKSARVEADILAAHEVGVRGTPTIVIGDTVYAVPPSMSQLRAMVEQRRQRAAR